VFIITGVHYNKLVR